MLFKNKKKKEYNPLIDDKDFTVAYKGYVPESLQEPLPIEEEKDSLKTTIRKWLLAAFMILAFHILGVIYLWLDDVFDVKLRIVMTIGVFVIDMITIWSYVVYG